MESLLRLGLSSRYLTDEVVSAVLQGMVIGAPNEPKILGLFSIASEQHLQCRVCGCLVDRWSLMYTPSGQHQNLHYQQVQWILADEEYRKRREEPSWEHTEYPQMLMSKKTV